jgi:hypothetical protein
MAKKREPGLAFRDKMTVEEVIKKMLNSPPPPSSKKAKAAKDTQRNKQTRRKTK